MKSSTGLALQVIISMFLVSACSSTQQAYLQNVQMYFDNDIDINLSDEEVRKSPVDLIYVTNGERAIATMALAFIEEGRYKWLSKDGAMFITENGRLIRTQGLEDNLIYLSNLNADPLKSLPHNNDLMKWNRVIDTEFDEYGVELSSQFSRSADDVLVLQGHDLKIVKYVERVNYYSAHHGDASWSNTFWFHQESGQLLKSVQTASPQSETIVMTYISRALRLVEH